MCLTACLGPQTSDELPSDETTYPSASDEIEAAESKAKWENKILSNQGFDSGTIPLLSGFIDGELAWFWDFGPGTNIVAPVYMLVFDVGDDADKLPTFTLEELMGWLPTHGVAHLPLFGVIPGNPGYTPLWQVVLVPTTDAYRGELITSVNAIQTAREDGLLGDLISLPHVVDCPVVHRDTLLGEGAETRAPNQAYWNGYKVSYFDLGFMGAEVLISDDGVEVTSSIANEVYTLRREGGEPLDERQRGVDMNGDGDLNDTNHIFDSLPGDPDYSPMVETTEVVVRSDTVSVDTLDNTAVPDVMGFDDLFDETGGPRTNRVIAISPQNQLRYLPRWNPPPQMPDSMEAADVETTPDNPDSAPIPDGASSDTESTPDMAAPGPTPDVPEVSDASDTPTPDTSPGDGE